MKHWRGRPRYTLSGKLILLFVGMALLFVLLVGASLRHVFSSHFENNIRPHLVQYLEYVQKDIGNPPSRERAQELAEKLNIEIYLQDSQGHWSSNQRTVDLDELEIEHRIIENGREYWHVESEDRDYLMTQADKVTLLFNVPHIRQEREGIKGFVPLVVLLLVLFILYYATRRIFSPIESIQKGVQRFGAGELDHRIDIKRHDELGDLANNFNNMADGIQLMLDAKRQLLLAISHELRSPLTRAKVASELLEDNSQKLQINRDLDEMENLIEEIMETERLSTSHKVLNFEQCDLKQLILEIKSTYFKNTPVELSLTKTSSQISADIARIKLLVKNLIENAVQHTPDGVAAPLIKLHDEADTVTFEVKDFGPGIEEQHIPYLTEPFYRVDPSRQRKTGGYGLGLYLCKMICEAHGGKLMIESKLGKGTRVVVSLPKQQNR